MFYKHRVLEALLDFNINTHFPLKPSVVINYLYKTTTTIIIVVQ